MEHELIKTKWSNSRGKVDIYVESGNVAISDNHRMAFYFFHKLGRTFKTLIHIDEHADCECFIERDFVCAQLLSGNIDTPQSFAQIDTTIKRRSMPPVQSGNWITALCTCYPEMFECVLLVVGKTIQMSAYPDVPGLSSFSGSPVDAVLQSTNAAVSLDLDYFFSPRPFKSLGAMDSARRLELFRDIVECSRVKMSPLFIALTPSFVGGYEPLNEYLQMIDGLFSTHVSQLVSEVNAR